MKLFFRGSMLIKTRRQKQINCLLKCLPHNIRKKGVCKVAMVKSNKIRTDAKIPNKSENNAYLSANTQVGCG